jgi:hypothetical protein
MTIDRESAPSTAANVSGRMSTHTEDLDFVATRTFDAPREAVFNAWSECEALGRWWGPTGWTLPVCEIDFREGGTWFYCMRSPEGEDSCGKSTYHEIVERGAGSRRSRRATTRPTCSASTRISSRRRGAT